MYKMDVLLELFAQKNCEMPCSPEKHCLGALMPCYFSREARKKRLYLEEGCLLGFEVLCSFPPSSQGPAKSCSYATQLNALFVRYRHHFLVCLWFAARRMAVAKEQREGFADLLSPATWVYAGEEKQKQKQKENKRRDCDTKCWKIDADVIASTTVGSDSNQRASILNIWQYRHYSLCCALPRKECRQWLMLRRGVRVHLLCLEQVGE